MVPPMAASVSVRTDRVMSIGFFFMLYAPLRLEVERNASYKCAQSLLLSVVAVNFYVRILASRYERGRSSWHGRCLKHAGFSELSEVSLPHATGWPLPIRAPGVWKVSTRQVALDRSARTRRLA